MTQITYIMQFVRKSCVSTPSKMVRMGKRSITTVSVALSSILFLANTCYVESPQGTKSATVPYVAQEGALYCTAACVLSWRLHDGLPSRPQLEILQAMGGTESTGASEHAIPIGVNIYTNTHDARHEYGPGGPYSDDQGRFFARQITSVNNGVPVIAITEQGLHAVVIDGGSWHTSPSGFRVWDTVEYMDPAFGYGTVSPSALINTMCPTDFISCRQVIGAGASSGGDSHYGTYGETTHIDGVCTDCVLHEY